MKIIINADDFGISKSIDEGIIYSYDNHLISDFSIMANGKNFQNAIQFLKERNINHTGCHVCLVDSEKMLSKDENKVLGKNGFFYKSSKPFYLLFSSFTNRDIKKQCRIEANLQIEKILDNNISISHLDSHQHVHLFPAITEVFLELCQKYKIKYLRYPIALKKNFRGFYFSIFSKILKFRLEKNNQKNLKTIGFDWDNGIDVENFKNLIKKFSSSNQVVEFLCHPGFVDEEVNKRFSHWNFKFWKDDIDRLNYLKKYLEENKIKLINYNELSQL